MSELVRVRIERAGCSLLGLILPRPDAERLIHRGLGLPECRALDFAIDPLPDAPAPAATPQPPETPVGWIGLFGFATSAIGFAVKHRSLLVSAFVGIALMVLMGLSIYLPSATLRTAAVAVLVCAALTAGFVVGRLPDPQ